MKRETLQKIMGFLFDHLTKTTYLGLENLPMQGGIIVVTNHMSRMDIPALFNNPKRPDITALIADKYTRYPGLGWIIRTGGAIYIDRERADFGAFRAAQELIQKGVAMGIAPEGTRSTSGQLLEGKPGAVLLAVKSGAPIIPVGLAGTESSFKKLFTLRRPSMYIRFGAPFIIKPIGRENRSEALHTATDEIMCRIAALLPSRYWGFYRDHPRLQALIEEQGGAVSYPGLE